MSGGAHGGGGGGVGGGGDRNVSLCQGVIGLCAEWVVARNEGGVERGVV